MADGRTSTDQELDRQLAVLQEQGVPALAGLDDAVVREAVDALRPALRGATGTVALVVAGEGDQAALVEALVPRLRLAGRDVPGVLDRNHGPEGLAPYGPTEVVGPPPAPVYALVGVERGEELCGVRPQDALPVVLGRGRTPLTLLEGVSLVLLHPHLLEKNRCFMLSGSRRGDRRVPALWISGRAPKLGWCWDGNPHTWLGTASTGSRVPQVTAADTSGGLSVKCLAPSAQAPLTSASRAAATNPRTDEEVAL